MSKQDREVEEIYQEKLQLHVNNLQSTLETILRVSMPHQLTNMKTILWINLLFLGFSFHLIKELGWVLWHYLFYMCTSVSIVLIIFALISRRHKYYGEINDLDYMYKLEHTLDGKTDALSAVLKCSYTAIEENRKIMKHLSTYMHLSTWFTLFATIFFVLTIFFQLNTKGGDEVVPKRPPSETKTPPPKRTPESSERSIPRQTQRPTPPPKSPPKK